MIGIEYGLYILSFPKMANLNRLLDNTWFLVLGTWYVVRGTWYLVLNTWYPTQIHLRNLATSSLNPVSHILLFQNPHSLGHIILRQVLEQFFLKLMKVHGNGMPWRIDLFVVGSFDLQFT